MTSKEGKTEMRINEGKKTFCLTNWENAKMVSNLPDYTIWGM
jgi:hypothetical protein